MGHQSMAGCSRSLAVLAALRLLNPYLLVLLCVFLVGVGFAFTAPTWPAVVAEMVSAQLPSATALLAGLQLNIAAIIGPTVRRSPVADRAPDEYI